MKEAFLKDLKNSLDSKTFIKLTLSKKGDKQSDLNNVYIRLIELKSTPHLSFTYRHQTKDITKNYDFQKSLDEVAALLGTSFLNGVLFTSEKDITIEYSRKRKARIRQQKPSLEPKSTATHDRKKHRFITTDRPFLQVLGITNTQQKVLKNKQDKFKQINKYIEIVDSQLKLVQLEENFHIVDMGAGKGYLTFALYDYITHTLGKTIAITGIELRQHLVDFCNKKAEVLGFENLKFIAQDIHDYHPERIDMLIALHACDIATDIAIYKGMVSTSKIIVVAPCCHKQVRKDMNTQSAMSSVLKHGILEERQAELITDGIRALLMESQGYKSKVFEFISNEHTSKNLMIIGNKVATKNQTALAEIDKIKSQFGIEKHYLEELLEH